MKKLISKSLIENLELANVIEDRVYQSSSLGIGDIPEKPKLPYILYTELPSFPYREVRETSNASLRTFQIYIYDEPGSFLRIEDLLELVRETLIGLAGVVSPSGARCTDVDWRGYSEDFTDTVRNEIFRFATFNFTSSNRYS